ncbi:arginine repressor [Demequina zhanjiangensis]|uniref:Arginine repressor n=1 Tax=Demequina zhanjiangensis TaxID=3051659 RepID=A0ABT8G3Q9_9MICO|nr:arginine repressor [Demequina sp. SYSU T00b26]MDN4473773.1 arginine repressor [Demequina sp. SYSU T00b26]
MAGVAVRAVVPATKAARQALVRRLIETERIGSQGEIAMRLEAEGISVTQATLSRDLGDIGAVKVRAASGGHVYAVGNEGDPEETTDERLTRLCGELLFSADGSANITVLRTPSGGAQYFASAIDAHDDADIVGTVAGDDTVLVISREADGGLRLAQKFLDRASGVAPQDH